MLTRPPARVRRTLALFVAAVAATALTACSGSGSTGDDGRTPDEVLAQAKTTLDETSGVRVGLSTEDLPEGVLGITQAEGVGTHAPAFDGSITVVLSGQPFEVPVVAVDGIVYAQIPLTPGWQDVDPGDYGAPDPAQLLDRDKGLSSLLPATTGVEKGDSIRGGKDNTEILTEYSGTVSADVVKFVIPGASGDFAATYTVTDEGELREARLTGVFYPDTESMTYTITFDEYGSTPQITAP